MRSRLILNIFLFFIVIGLALFLSRNTNDDVEQDTLLTSIDPDNINTITIQRRDLGEISFVKNNNQWQMRKPFDIAANKSRINTMLNLLQAYSYTQLDKNEVELNQFLLDDPVVTLNFDDTAIEFGDTSPLGEDKLRYVLIKDTIHLVNDSLYQQLLTNASFFISPRLLPENVNIKKLNLPQYDLQQIDGIWKINPALDISADDIISIINAWQNAEAITVRKFIEQGVQDKITIEFDQLSPIEFKVISPRPNLVLARPEFNVQYHISSYEADQLFPVENKTIPSDPAENIIQ